MPSKLAPFFATHPVFTVDELDDFLATLSPGNPQTRQSLLKHHQKQGHILGIRRGLYASIPANAQPDTVSVDPFLLASRLTDDAVLAYHTALAFHGAAHSLHTAFTVVSAQTHIRPLHFRHMTYRAVTMPASLLQAHEPFFAVETPERAGLAVRVTSLERTLVDVLDRPSLAGGWEEIWHSFEEVGYLNVDTIVSYVLLLKSATVAAKVGYFLELHQDTLMVEETQLQQLQQHRPHQPRYLDRAQKTGRFVPAWNLIVPIDVATGSWKEML